MRGTIQILLSLSLAAAPAIAQESRHEITTTVSPQDAKPNNSSVPDVQSIPTQFERVVVLRFKFGVDLLAGLEQAVKQNKIRNGVILNGFGSVRNYQIHQVSNRTLPSKNMFVKDPVGQADIAAMSGFVLNGRLHPHITLASPDKAFAGHLEPGTNVFTFAVVTIGVLPDSLDLGNLDDKNYR
jgi:predicted DNA-binding protein with PD1-like motif